MQMLVSNIWTSREDVKTHSRITEYITETSVIHKGTFELSQSISIELNRYLRHFCLDIQTTCLKPVAGVINCDVMNYAFYALGIDFHQIGSGGTRNYFIGGIEEQNASVRGKNTKLLILPFFSGGGTESPTEVGGGSGNWYRHC